MFSNDAKAWIFSIAGTQLVQILDALKAYPASALKEACEEIWGKENTLAYQMLMPLLDDVKAFQEKIPPDLGERLIEVLTKDFDVKANSERSKN